MRDKLIRLQNYTMKFFIKYLYLSIFILSSCAPLHVPENEKILEKIFKEHCLQLKNTDIKQPPFFITFSGTPGMGKTFLAKQLEDKYKAVRIRTDDIRRLVESNLSNQRKQKDYENVLEEYLKYFFKHYKLANKRFILDASIDRRYKTLFPKLKAKNIKFVVIRLKVPRDLIAKRFTEREGDKANWYIKKLDAWLSDYDNFAAQYKDYISYENNNEIRLDKLFEEIDKEIKQ
jgi:predicted kinase